MECLAFGRGGLERPTSNRIEERTWSQRSPFEGLVTRQASSSRLAQASYGESLCIPLSVVKEHMPAPLAPWIADREVKLAEPFTYLPNK